MKPILYDSFEYKYEFCRRCQIKIINTKFYNKQKDMNIITRFTWFDYDDLWEEELEGELSSDNIEEEVIQDDVTSAKEERKR